MINLVNCCSKKIKAKFIGEAAPELKELTGAAAKIFRGEYLQTAFVPENEESLLLLVGTGKPGRENIHLKELGAAAVKAFLETKIYDFSLDISGIIREYGINALRHITEGAVLGTYVERQFKKEENREYQIEICGVQEELLSEAQKIFDESIIISEGICFARDMVNLPGNHLRPSDFAENILEFVKDTDVETKVLDREKLKEKGFEALLGVGDSSEFPPCLTVLRYRGKPESGEVTALVGKGVTCDTGGYCLKPGSSMLGIKGDMAGGAAVAGAVYALARNHAKVNAVAVIPMCENRISDGSLLPGDVIGSYSGKTIEIANTDAEGRLILADAVSYAVREEGATEILDIATLTGAVVNMFGFTVAGVVSDDDSLFERFRNGFTRAGERYWRIPFYEEHEKMIESRVADVRNMSSGGCGTITAGLFIREFAEKRPWIHLDIAGTAWVDDPVFAFQSAGATGAGVSSIYQFLCRN